MAQVEIDFHLVDVFAERPLTGNPLAVVAEVDGLDDDTMRDVVRELQQAETTFLLRPRMAAADWRLRSFTAAGVEVFGAGHNSLGAWWWMAESGRLHLSDGVTVLVQEIGERLLPVEIERSGHGLQSVTLTQAPPVFGKCCQNWPALAGALGLSEEDFAAGLPAQTVSTGTAHLLVPVKNRAAVGHAHPEAGKLAEILSSTGAQGCYLFSLDAVSPSAAAHARFFNPTVGLFEDAATGSAAGPLACQLVARGVVRAGTAITIEQGYEMERPSLLRVEVLGDSARLSGRCVTVGNGKLRVR